MINLDEGKRISIQLRRHNLDWPTSLYSPLIKQTSQLWFTDTLDMMARVDNR